MFVFLGSTEAVGSCPGTERTLVQVANVRGTKLCAGGACGLCLLLVEEPSGQVSPV